MNSRSLINKLMKDIKVELDDEFDHNFERKAFFDRRWKPTKKIMRIGSLLLRTGALRNSIRSQIEGMNIKYTSSLPYADIHNRGGVIKVPAKKGASKKNKISRGHSITIPQRQFIGDHPQVKKSIQSVTNDWVNNELKNELNRNLKKIFK